MNTYYEHLHSPYTNIICFYVNSSLSLETYKNGGLTISIIRGKNGSSFRSKRFSSLKRTITHFAKYHINKMALLYVSYSNADSLEGH